MEKKTKNMGFSIKEKIENVDFAIKKSEIIIVIFIAKKNKKTKDCMHFNWGKKGKKTKKTKKKINKSGNINALKKFH